MSVAIIIAQQKAIARAFIIHHEAIARMKYANSQYRRARRRLIVMAAALSNSDGYGKPVLMQNLHYFFETMWDESEALWIDAQQQAIGWASR